MCGVKLFIGVGGQESLFVDFPEHFQQLLFVLDGEVSSGLLFVLEVFSEIPVVGEGDLRMVLRVIAVLQKTKVGGSVEKGASPNADPSIMSGNTQLVTERLVQYYLLNELGFGTEQAYGE